MAKFVSLFLCVFIIVQILVVGCLGLGNSPSPSNLTQWEKSQTQDNCMCSNNIYQVGDLSIYSPATDQIGTIYLTIALAPGANIPNLTDMNFTLSTANYTKTVRYGDNALHFGGGYQNKTIILDKQAHTDLKTQLNLQFNISEMGFNPNTFGPGQRVVIVVTTPKDYGWNTNFYRIFTVPQYLQPNTFTRL